MGKYRIKKLYYHMSNHWSHLLETDLQQPSDLKEESHRTTGGHCYIFLHLQTTEQFQGWKLREVLGWIQTALPRPQDMDLRERFQQCKQAVNHTIIACCQYNA